MALVCLEDGVWVDRSHVDTIMLCVKRDYTKLPHVITYRLRVSTLSGRVINLCDVLPDDTRAALRSLGTPEDRVTEMLRSAPAEIEESSGITLLGAPSLSDLLTKGS